MVYEFGLKNVKIQEIRAARSNGTGTDSVLVSGTGTILDGTDIIWSLHKWYQCHPILVSVLVTETAQKWQIFPISLAFLPYSSSIPSYFKNLS